MKIKNARTISLIAAALLLASCGDSTPTADDGGKTTDTTVPVTEAAEENAYPYEIKDYEGYTFRFLNGADEFWTGANHILDYDEDQSDSVASAVYQRNRKAEEDLNIQIEVIKEDVVADGTITLNKMKTAVLAGDDAYDVVYALLNFYGACSLVGGYQLNLHDIDTLHLDQEWWNQNYIAETTLADNVLYTIPDYVNLMGYCYGSALYFNKTMLIDHNLEMPYDYVRNGTWTFEKFFEYYVKELISLNGDADYTLKQDGNCIYGIGVSHEEGTRFFLNGGGSYLIGKDENNLLVLNEDQNRLFDVYDRLQSYISNDGYCAMINTAELHGGRLFLQGRTAFTASSIGAGVSVDFREMKDEYGVLPFPKYDEQQQSYHTTISAHTLASNIPKTASDPARTGNILDYLAYKSYYDVIPVLQEALCYKGVRDDDSIEMLNILLETQHSDIGFLYGPSMDMIQSLCNKSNLLNGNGNFASTLEKQTKQINKNIETLFADFGNDE